MIARESEIRTVVVSNSSWELEAAGVFRTMIVIAITGLLISGMHAETPESSAAVYTYQVFFHRQPDQVQRLYRELMSAFEDALLQRISTGAWPTVEQLKEDAIPPFAPLPGAADYSWELRVKYPFLNYFGHPSDSSNPTFLLYIQEDVPHPPGTPLTDFHRRLDDGSVLHFQIMFHENPILTEEIAYNPELEGWKQIIMSAQGAAK